jgi:hypothetical protein
MTDPNEAAVRGLLNHHGLRRRPIDVRVKGHIFDPSSLAARLIIDFCREPVAARA